MRTSCFAVGLLVCIASVSAEELTLDNVTRPPANTRGEPLAESFSFDKAVRYLDRASLDWTKRRRCFTCHTNYSYLMARPSVSADVKAHRQVRAALQDQVETRWPDKGPRWDAEVVMTAATLAVNDRDTTSKLHATTRKALDRMWTVQKEHGGFDWLKCGWPPMESDDDYGASIALIAVHAAPDGYLKTPAAQQGLRKLRDYLRNNPPPTLHHKAMLLWADSFGAKSLKPDERDAAIQELLKRQQPDGGWAIATLGNWKRADGLKQDTKTSDGYGTGFVIYVLRQAGLPAADKRLQRGIAWLKANQRESGRWFTRSLNRDNKHLIAHAGTAFAVMALKACEE